MRKLILVCLFLFFIFIELFSDLEIFDEDDLYQTDEHFYVLQEKINIQTASKNDLFSHLSLTNTEVKLLIDYRKKKLLRNSHYLSDAGLSDETIERILPGIIFAQSEHFNYQLNNYFRFQEKTNSYRILNRFNADNDKYSFKFHYETNTSDIKLRKLFGFSLMIAGNPNSWQPDRLILGQYSIQHAYGLLISKGAFVSQRPSFNTDYKKNNTMIYSNARNYHSRSLVGMVFEKNITDIFTVFLFSSLKENDAKIEDGKIIRMNIVSHNPESKVMYSYNGIILKVQTEVFAISTALNYAFADKEFYDSKMQKIDYSLAGSYQFKDWLFFFESAYAKSSFAKVFGIKNRFQRFSHTFAYRQSDKDYLAYYADFICNNASLANEQALFYKIDYRYQKYLIQTYADVFNHKSNHERYLDKNIGSSLGLKVEKQAIFKFDDMALSVSLRRKTDKEWRNFDGISAYHQRNREYLRVVWQQTKTKFLTTRLTLNYQTKEYIDMKEFNQAYGLSQNIRLNFNNLRISFTTGVYDAEIPMYIYSYSGRLNNPLLILSGEGVFTVLHLSQVLSKRIRVEGMMSYLDGINSEYNLSMLVLWNF